MNFLALITFCIVSTVTPGPNNLMLMSSGATFGLRRTVPHLLGVTLGFTVMVLVIGWGVGGATRQLPAFHQALQLISAIYLLWLAWRIATSAPPEEAEVGGRPMTFLQAAAFQWVNPKAWASILAAITSFARPEFMSRDVPMVALVMLVVGAPLTMLWAVSGTAMRRFLHTPRALRLFNYAMAALLVLSILPGLWDTFGPER